MMERIRELVKQAGGHFSTHTLMSKPVQYRESIELWDDNIEKFAELIVEECRYVMDCNKGSDQNPVWNQALSETSEKIKQHFGITE